MRNCCNAMHRSLHHAPTPFHTTYDALNRVTSRSYSTPSGTPGTGLLASYEAIPNVSYYYDNLTNAKGKLIKVTNGVGDNRSTTEYTAFDILGRVTAHKQTTDGNVYTTGYKYNLAGALIEETYPSGRVVRNTLDSNGDLMAVLGRKSTHPQFWAYANNFKYSAAGAVTETQLGNGLWESTQFNERLQPMQIALGSAQNGTDKLKLNYQYGDLDWDGSVIAGSNNGNVAKQMITVAAVGVTPGFTAVQNYDYDSLNRIQIASETLTPTTGTPENWVQEFQYDRYGNRTFKESTTTTLPKECNGNTEVCAAARPIVNPSANPSDNKLAGYAFDSAGNTTQDAENRKFTYDAENKQTRVETVSGATVTGTVGEYFYDGDGHRMKKRVYVDNVPTEETIFVYDASAKLVGEYSNQVASPQDAKLAYLTNDYLGSPRINTDVNGNVVARHDYHPFGEEVASSRRAASIGYSDDTVRKRFTGYEGDSETDLDYAKARYYSKGHGRFTASDPIIIELTRLTDPQRINLYVYSRNNPLKFADSTGEDIELKNGTSKKDADVIVDALVSIYMRQLGNESLNAMERSDKKITIGVGDVKEDPGTPANVVDHGRTVLTDTDKIEVTLDFRQQEKDQAAADKTKNMVVGQRNPPPSQDEIVKHEIAHVADAFDDPTGYHDKSDNEEKRKEIQKAMDKSPKVKDLTKDQAREKIRSMLRYDEMFPEKKK